MIGTARFDATGSYRYELTRTWGRVPPVKGVGAITKPDQRVAFVMLNPSTATAEVLDPTVRRCVGYAARWGYGGLVVVNIFALRSTDPQALYDHPDPVGPDNDRVIARAVGECELAIAAWGTHGELHGRGQAVVELLAPVRPLQALKVTKEGHPNHPLYLRADLVPFDLATAIAGLRGGRA